MSVEFNKYDVGLSSSLIVLFKSSVKYLGATFFSIEGIFPPSFFTQIDSKITAAAKRKKLPKKNPIAILLCLFFLKIGSSGGDYSGSEI